MTLGAAINKDWRSFWTQFYKRQTTEFRIAFTSTNTQQITQNFSCKPRSLIYQPQIKFTSNPCIVRWTMKVSPPATGDRYCIGHRSCGSSFSIAVGDMWCWGQRRCQRRLLTRCDRRRRRCSMRLVTTSGRRLANALYNVRQRLAFGCSRNITGSNCVMLQMIVKLLPYSMTFFSEI